MIDLYLYSPEAAEDVFEAASNYSEAREGLGREFSDEVERQVRSLMTSPHRCIEVRPGIRQAVVRRFPHLIFYSIVGNILYVVAVIPSRRDPAHIDRILGER